MIGRIAGYEVDSKTGYWDISVELNQKMGNLQKVFVVRNLKKLELKQIQDTLDATIKND
jgi:rod shape-determining protein MreC